MKPLVLATHNPGKVSEFTLLLPKNIWQLQTLSDWHIPAVTEVHFTFIENALQKARYAAEQTGLPALADDSGLVIPALDGAPGVLSARFAGNNATDQENIQKVLTLMQDILPERRQAYFYCVLIYLRHASDPAPCIAQGIWQGHIATQPRGQNGFGYDPIFYVPTHQCHAAELTPKQKQQISHRAQALRQLLALLPDA